MTEIAVRNIDIIAAEIISIENQAKNIVLHSAIEVGRRLIEAKSQVPHGEWGKWLNESVDYSQSKANSLMQLCREYGENYQALGNLNYTQAIALLALPADQREAFAEENNVADMSTRELQAAIKAREELEQQLKESQEKERIALEAHERETQKRKDLEERNKKQQQLIEELGQAQSEGDVDAAAQLQAELEASKRQIKELEEELRKKPIDIPAKEIIEVIPEATQQELETLRQREQELAAEVHQREEQAAKQIADMQEQLRKNNNTAAIKVKVHFDALVGNFKDLLTAVSELQNEDQKKAIQDRIAKLCDEMKGAV